MQDKEIKSFFLVSLTHTLKANDKNVARIFD